MDKTFLVAASATAAVAVAACMAFRQRPPRECPTVPVVPAVIPFLRSTLSFATNPRKFLEEARRKHGDTFFVEMLGIKLLFVFSAAGVRSLYQLPENDASFTEATRGLLGLKIPQEIIAEGDLRKFHVGLKQPLLKEYIVHINNVVDESIAALPSEGEFEIFTEMKSVVFQIGLRCWVGQEVANSEYIPELIEAFQALDPETAFQDLRSLFTTWMTAKRKEKAAILTFERILRKIWESRGGDEIEDNLSTLHSLYHDLTPELRYRRVAFDVFHFLVASQANLYAAMSWSLINILTAPQQERLTVLNEINQLVSSFGNKFSRDLDIVRYEMPMTENFILETLRLVQQSLTLRKVLNPVTLLTEIGPLQVPVGVTIATLLSITNVDDHVLPPQPDLHAFIPERYREGSLRKDVYSPEVSCHASVFGHGRHACPGRLFALSAIKSLLAQYVLQLEMRPLFEAVSIPQSSVGAIARATHPCRVAYRRR